jgi:hypothetical protein
MHFMNKQREAHMTGKPQGEASGDVSEASGQHHPPQIHIHSHAKGHTVHIMHHSGQHEKHEHAHGDSDGIAQHIHTHLGGPEGQDHGVGDGEEMENEQGYGGPGV